MNTTPHPLPASAPPVTLWAPLARLGRDRPHDIGLHFLGRDWTWAQLVQEARHLAGALQCLGLQPGGRVLLFMQNCPQYVVGFHAVQRAGGVVVPVNPMNKADELPHCIRDSGARIALASTDVAAELSTANDTLPQAQALTHLVVFDLADGLPSEWQATPNPDWPATWPTWLCARPSASGGAHAALHRWADLLARGLEPTPVAVQPTDLALLPYTSGTTGAAKGCLHTHQTLGHNAQAAGPWLDMRAGDRTLIVVPLFHITGLVMGMLASIRHGCRLVLLPRWDRREAAHTIARQGVTHWPNIPTMVIDLLADATLTGLDWSSLRYIGGGGAPMPDPVAEELKRRSGLDYVEGYGLTETAAPTHLNPLHAPRRRCLGVPFVDTQALVVDPATLQPLPLGEVGEIAVRGPQVFHGYWHNPQATQDAFFEHAGQTWFRTGDLGRVDEDGCFYMVDRLKRMINASGFKVWPSEVEALLHRHPAVKESCVIAVRDNYRGESVKAVIVLRDEARGQVTEDDIIQWAKGHMAAYKYPRVVAFADQLPRTASGKVLWRKVQEAEDGQRRISAPATWGSAHAPPAPAPGAVEGGSGG